MASAPVPPVSAEAAALARQLDQAIALIVTEANAAELARRCAMTPAYAMLLLEIYCNEARVGLTLIAPGLRPGLRILEVGSGIGLLSSVLAAAGYEIIGIEPGASGFGFMPALAAIIADQFPAAAPFTPLPIGAEALNRAAHGMFDLIYSVNVLEHMAELDAAMAAMSGVLAKGGAMVHMCPNYAFPYEPHLTMPLVPGFPALTRHIFPARTRLYPGLWESLNFITARRLRKTAEQSGLSASFQPGTMGQMVRRLLTDPVLARRQGRFIRLAASIATRTGLLALVDIMPHALATPMVVTLTKKP